MRRPRLRALARWLRRLARRVYPEALYTLNVVTDDDERTFIDCRELR